MEQSEVDSGSRSAVQSMLNARRARSVTCRRTTYRGAFSRERRHSSTGGVCTRVTSRGEHELPLHERIVQRMLHMFDNTRIWQALRRPLAHVEHFPYVLSSTGMVELAESGSSCSLDLEPKEHRESAVAWVIVRGDMWPHGCDDVMTCGDLRLRTRWM